MRPSSGSGLRGRACTNGTPDPEGPTPKAGGAMNLTDLRLLLEYHYWARDRV